MNRKKIFSIITMAAVIIFLFLFSGWLLIQNKSDKIEVFKSKSVFIAEKDLLNGEIRDLVSEKRNLNALNKEDKNLIFQLQKEIDQKNREINDLLNNNPKIKGLTIRINQLEQEKKELLNKIDEINSDLNFDKTVFDNELSALKAENERLNTELIFVKSVNLSGFLINGVKQDEKITVFAKKTKIISLAFDYPENYFSELKVKVLTPDGKTYNNENKDVISLIQSNRTTESDSFGLVPKHIELQLKANKKFSKGIYTFSIYKSNDIIANMRIHLK